MRTLRSFLLRRTGTLIISTAALLGTVGAASVADAAHSCPDRPQGLQSGCVSSSVQGADVERGSVVAQGSVAYFSINRTI
jgi:hypothetical protein